MIPPSQQMQQAQAMQRAMMPQGRPEDPLLQALSQKAMEGDMLKEKAQHMMKMIKLKMKYGNQMIPQGGGGGGMPPQGQGQPPVGGGGY